MLDQVPSAGVASGALDIVNAIMNGLQNLLLIWVGSRVVSVDNKANDIREDQILRKRRK